MARNSNQLTCHFATAYLALALVSLLTVGCAAPWLESYDHDQSILCRIDNSDRDSLWDTSDTNGNGVIDENETVGPVFDFAQLPRANTSGPDSRFSTSAIRTIPQNSFRTVQVNFSTPPGFLSGFQDDIDTDAGVLLGEFPSTGLIGIADDFYDLQIIQPVLSRIVIVPYTETYGMQISQTHRYSRSPAAEGPSEEKLFFEVAYGARYHRLRETFGIDAYGGVLGRTTLDATYDNELLGPQLAFKLGNQFFGWDLQLGSTLMLGYDLAKASQLGSMGQNLVPGQYNHPLYFAPTVIVNEQENDDFASIAELHVQAAYALSQSSTLRFGYTSLYFSHLRHVDTSINWSLPSFGINSSVTKDTWVSGLYASVEWRR